jgi:hypothetical protein
MANMSRAQKFTPLNQMSRWAGPALLLAGLVLLGTDFLFANWRQDTVLNWLFLVHLSPARMIPLAGLVIVVGLVSRLRAVLVILAFGIGFPVGFAIKPLMISAFGNLPGAIEHLLLSTPIACLCASMMLLLPGRGRDIVLVPASLAIGAMQAVAIGLTDPTLHDPALTYTGVLVSMWAVVSVGLCLRRFYRKWFVICGRIAGSWLLAIGLLYGGTALVVPPRNAPSPAAGPQIPGSTAFPDQGDPFADPSQNDGPGNQHPSPLDNINNRPASIDPAAPQAPDNPDNPFDRSQQLM